jgi:hypothetical protein
VSVTGGRYFAEELVDPISIVAGLVQTGLYLDFFYIYFTKCVLISRVRPRTGSTLTCICSQGPPGPEIRVASMTFASKAIHMFYSTQRRSPPVRREKSRPRMLPLLVVIHTFVYIPYIRGILGNFRHAEKCARQVFAMREARDVSPHLSYTQLR